MTTQAQSWRMYEEERADIHDFLASLEPEQWDAPSLCEGLRVRDVAVHLLVDGPIEEIGAPRALVKAATFRFSVHRVNAWWVEHNHDRPTDSIVAAFGGPWRPGWVSRRLGPAMGMRATVVHHQDMRRPLGMARETSVDVILTPRGGKNLGSFERSKGVGLRATDLDWSWGEGLEVSGPAESILMALAGRTSALADLSGAGVATLAGRVEVLH